MNAIFAAIFLAAAVIFCLRDPAGFLPAMLTGGERAATLTLTLLASYCVWLGFFKVLEASGLSQKLARLLYPAARRLFRSDDEQALSAACCAISANLLSLPGAPTPLGIEASRRFFAENNPFGAYMLFVLHAAGVQLFSTTALSLRLAAGSSSPADIVLPILLSTLASAALAILLLFLTAPRTGAHPRLRRACR